MITQTDLTAMLAHMPNFLPPKADTTLQPAQGVITPLYDWLKNASKPSALRRPRVAVFVANNDVFLTALKNPEAALNKLCLAANADLRVYDLGNTTQGDTAQAFTYGLLAVEEGVDVLIPFAVSNPSITLDTAPTANGLEALQQTNNIALAAMCGAMVAARMAQVPVLIDDATGEAAAHMLSAWQADITHHIFNLVQHNMWHMQRPPAEQALLLVPVLRGLLNS